MGALNLIQAAFSLQQSNLTHKKQLSSSLSKSYHVTAWSTSKLESTISLIFEPKLLVNVEHFQVPFAHQLVVLKHGP